MHSFSLPNPLARLIGLLETVEHARAVSATPPGSTTVDRTPSPSEAPDESQPWDRNEDLDRMSLELYGESLEPHSHDLAAMSLSRDRDEPSK